MDEAGANSGRRRRKRIVAAATAAATVLLCRYAWETGCNDGGRSLLSVAMLGLMFGGPFATFVWNGLCLWHGDAAACVRTYDEDGKQLSLRFTMAFCAAFTILIVLAAGTGDATCGASSGL